MKNNEKTNVMRVLEQKKIPYESFCYEETGMTNGVEIANWMGQDPSCVFKTLVTVAKSKQNYVFMIPVAKELDLKKAAKAAGEKSVEMIPQKELLPLTGYIHGGCSPIGMKKSFPTFIDESSLEFDEIYFSGGKVGYQVKVAPENLKKVVRITGANLCKD